MLTLDDGTFDFWVEVGVEDFEKASKKTGEEKYNNMILSGIASTDEEDSDNQILLNKGFDLEYLLDRGFINWHHGAKDRPAAIIGEPIEAKLVKEGLFLKAQLYDTAVSRQAYDLALTLQKQSKKRRLGWSIEGKTLEKEGNIIKKARITHVALTHAPKNKSTFAEICKAFGQDDLIKSINTEKDGILIPEDLEDSTKVVTYKMAIQKVMNKYPNITFCKAMNITDKIFSNKQKR
jgi:hypothetical protein